MNVSHGARLLKLELDVVSRLCENIGTPRAIMVYMLIKDKQFDELADLSFDPSNYLDHQHARVADDYLVTAILSKNPRLPVSANPEEAAMVKFWEAESRCAETNTRLDLFSAGRDLPDRDILRVVLKAQQYIARILGPLTRSKLSYAEDHMRFGPGSTTSLSGVVTQGKKYSHRSLDATPRALPFRTFCFPERWKAFATEISPRRSSKLRVVPKKATCGRTICIEPDLNIFIQLGFGALIRKQLHLFGLDLSTQSINQEAARRASISGRNCTMDLTSASDLNARASVWLMLPYDWANALHFSRVDFIEDSEGREHELHKWSSMGNGYTFELETLIFYSIALAAVDEKDEWDAETEVCCYGDDLIFPSSCSDLVTRTLEFLGFKVNTKKTFGSGLFRESCGADFFNGHNVRPIFLRTQHHDYETATYITANRLREWGSRRNGEGSVDARLLPSWLRCFTALGIRDRHIVPTGYGDVGFEGQIDPKKLPASRGVYLRRGWEVVRFYYRRIEAVSYTISEEGCLTAFLNGNFSDFSLAREDIRGRYTRPKTRIGSAFRWTDLGPWR